MHTSVIMAVNSPPVAHRDVAASSYRPYNDDYAHIQRTRLENTVPQEGSPERTKKDKKWSLGKLFRRKKKDDGSASTSESDEGISALSPSKKKAKKKKKSAPSPNANFDHIVLRETRRAQSLMKQSNRDFGDDGVLSDPSAGFINYRSKIPHEPCNISKESLNVNSYGNSSNRIPSESAPKKTRKGRLKARVEALRNSMKGDSSSDEESIKSSNSSSMVRFRSEDSLMRSRDSSLNKRSRSARNERYIKRLSRDEENLLNKEAELLQQGYTKAEVEMLTRTPTSQSSGYGTCKRENLSNKYKPEQIYANDLQRRPMKSDSISSFPSTQSYPSSINFNAKVNNDHVNYSIQYPANNMCREPKFVNNNRNVQDHYELTDNVMCVKFPLGNVTNIKREERAPPVPPPRDMQRKVVTPLSMYYENNPLVTDRMAGNRNVVHGVPNNDFDRVMRRSQDRSLHPFVNGLRRPISTSEDHIAMQNNDFSQILPVFRGEQPRRPASVSAEPNHYSIYSNSPPWRKKIEQPPLIKPEAVQARQDYMYYADHSPRSRRPISIQSSQNNPENVSSDSQSTLNKNEIIYRKPRNASDFWKKLDDAEKQRKQQAFSNGRCKSEGPVGPKYRQKLEQNGDIENKNKPNQSCDVTDDSRMWKATTEYKTTTNDPSKNVTSPTSKAHARHKSDTGIVNNHHVLSDEERGSERRKSTNLDDALNELEAIYNSLGLGDEDLLDRAERRESMTPKFNDLYNDWNGNDEIRLRSQPTTPLRRIQRRSTLPDKIHDDMAFRRLNSKDRPVSKDPPTQISYMLASPVYIPYTSDDDRHSEHDKNEPDVVFDDVVYRNIKQANNRLKTHEPQPPFGIPLGPVSPAPQSDYLHATPENKARSRFIPRRSPDLVSDDLAYRSLRKDNRHSSVFNGDEYPGQLNNNHPYNELLNSKESPASLKKKRAVRSLSANIFSIVQKEIDEAINMSRLPSLHKTESNGDVSRRLRESIESNDHNLDHYPRNKVKQRHNTVSLFFNKSHSPTHFAKDDSYVHNDNNYLAKPPSCDKSKSSSPLSRSPQSSKRSSKDEFQQVLSKLAQEAMDTSNKLGVALAELDKNKHNADRKSEISNKISDRRMLFLNTLTNKNNNDHDLKHAQKELVTESRPSVSSVIQDHQSFKARNTEDSLLAISDQLHKVENKLKHSYEKEIKFQDESVKLSEYSTKTDKESKANETTVVSPDNHIVPNIVPISVQNDSINVNNYIHNEVNYQIPNNSQNSMNNNLHDINEINAFKELKNGISDLIAGISQVNDKLFTNVEKSNEENIQVDKVTGITEASEKLNKVTQNLENDLPPTNRASVNLSIYEDDLEVKKEVTDSTEYNSSEELATIFNLDQSIKKRAPVTFEGGDKAGPARDDLNSPKLVQSVNQQLRKISVDNTNDCAPSQSNSLSTNVVPWRTKRQSHNSQTENEGNNSSGKTSWHESAGTLMLACTYTLAISQHLADMDWLTTLGLLLAIITIVAMLLL